MWLISLTCLLAAAILEDRIFLDKGPTGDGRTSAAGLEVLI